MMNYQVDFLEEPKRWPVSKDETQEGEYILVWPKDYIGWALTTVETAEGELGRILWYYGPFDIMEPPSV